MATGRIGTTPALGFRWSIEPAGGTTSLSGLDGNSVGLSYTPGNERVYRNGVLLSRVNDYTATSGNSITLNDATVAGDIIEVFSQDLTQLADTIARSTLTAKGQVLTATAASTPAVLAVGANDTVLTADSSTATGLKWGTISTSPTFAGCVLQLASAVSVNSATITTIDFSTEIIDTDGYHSNSVNSSRITIPTGKAGKYFIYAQASFDATNGGGFQRVWINKNGTDIATALTPRVSLSSQEQTIAVSFVADLIVGDYLTMTVRQDSGTAINLDSTRKTAFFAYLLGA